MGLISRDKCEDRFLDDGIVRDDNGDEVSPMSDDYGYWEAEQDRLTNPLFDDYCKYDNE